ncbi:EG45-like domain containing protein [Impatiens glandulifera]|uniref:EG45-like domain containing protein n=1 Tax=Impatiens glandulifera TaxID=253017 RepID=UPI001FB13743|nr:EG45-like domain containing protein [Impatiens glandulifera]
MENRMISSMFVMMLCMASSCLIPTASAIAGRASFYTVYTPSSCYGFEDQGTLIAAANPSLFNNKAACGRMYRITCTGPTNQGVPQPCRGSVTVKIVDLCPGCAADQFDLSQEAFSAIADPNAGVVTIDYVQV